MKPATAHPAPAPKKPYAPPKLVTYGEVRVLTQSQSSGSSEGSNGIPPQKPACDRRLKDNVVRVGEHPLGIGLYLFDYKPQFQAEYGLGRQFGVMADEVELVMPQAVTVNAMGFKTVDLQALGVHRPLH